MLSTTAVASTSRSAGFKMDKDAPSDGGLRGRRVRLRHWRRLGSACMNRLTHGLDGPDEAGGGKGQDAHQPERRGKSHDLGDEPDDGRSGEGTHNRDAGDHRDGRARDLVAKPASHRERHRNDAGEAKAENGES